MGSDKTYAAIVRQFSGNVKNQKLNLWGFHIVWNMEHSSEPNFAVLLVSTLEIFPGIEISLASSNGLTRPAGPDLVRGSLSQRSGLYGVLEVLKHTFPSFPSVFAHFVRKTG